MDHNEAKKASGTNASSDSRLSPGLVSLCVYLLADCDIVDLRPSTTSILLGSYNMRRVTDVVQRKREKEEAHARSVRFLAHPDVRPTHYFPSASPAPPPCSAPSAPSSAVSRPSPRPFRPSVCTATPRPCSLARSGLVRLKGNQKDNFRRSRKPPMRCQSSNLLDLFYAAMLH